MPSNMNGQVNEWIDEDVPVVAATVTKEEFAGTISWFDNYNIALETEDGEVVLFKGALVYIREAD
ncbi:MAG: hypothetical protein V5A79_05705 [Candidatus Bipolaricaulota bacterium]